MEHAGSVPILHFTARCATQRRPQLQERFQDLDALGTVNPGYSSAPPMHMLLVGANTRRSNPHEPVVLVCFLYVHNR